MIKEGFKIYLEELINREGFSASPIHKITPISGGSINETYGLFTQERNFFLKVNNRNRFPNMFELESSGLSILKKNTSLNVPESYLVDEYKTKSFFLMQHIASSAPQQNFWENFAKGLAELHKCSSDFFGLNENNFNGSLTQVNTKKDNWADFFIENRLMVQEQLARVNNLIDNEVSALLAKLYYKANELFPKEPPSLLHGDLWSGNFMINSNGSASIMDPAIYYGHREMDIAMSHLFGGFSKQFYETYHEVFPLEKGWQQRIEVCNLYPLLVHVNLFGASYARRLKSILKKIA